MCQHFCFGGIILIIVFTIAFTIAIFLNIRTELSKYSQINQTQSNSDSNSDNHVINSRDLNSFKICEPLVSSDFDDIFRDESENIPLVVQLNYRTKGNNIENLCNGVAIHTNYILTLAQCVFDNKNRELIGASVNMTQNRGYNNLKIINIIIYDELVNHSLDLSNNIALIKTEDSLDVSNRFCMRHIQQPEMIPSIWNGQNIRLSTCNLSKLPNRICANSIPGGHLGDPLIEHHNGVWYLIGLHQASKSFPAELSIYTDVYLYRNWILNIIRSDP